MNLLVGKAFAKINCQRSDIGYLIASSNHSLTTTSKTFKKR